MLTAFLFKVAVADRKDLVQNDDIRLDETCYRKGYPRLHAGGQGAEGVILKITHIRKVDYLVVLRVDKLL